MSPERDLMTVFKMVLPVALVFIGVCLALLGAAILLGAITTGSIAYSYGTGADTVSQTVTLAADAGRYWKMLAVMCGLPIVFGSAAAFWGWRRLSQGL